MIELINATPESQGLSSKYVTEFLQEIKEQKFDLHAFIIIKGDKVLAEGYSEPFNKDYHHRVYSSSKTYSAIAIGKLIGEGKAKLTDKLIDFFPEYKKDCHPTIAETTLEDALTMQVSLASVSYADVNVKFAGNINYTYKPSGWAKSFFVGTKGNLPNGMKFRYNTAASYLLNAIVYKVTGLNFLEYLRPEFDEMGISKDIDCVQSPDGVSWGGSGVLTTLRDFAKIGRLLLNKGKINGKQLIPQDFMEKAVSKHTENCISGLRMNNTCGYGYQIWVEPYGFGLHGMNSNSVHCFPEKDVIIAYQGGVNDQVAKVALYDKLLRIYKNIEKEPIEENPNEYSQMQKALGEMSLGKGYGEKYSKTEEKINGKKFRLKENPMGINWVKVCFDKDGGKFVYENERGVKEFLFGREEYVKFELPEIYSGIKLGEMMKKGYDSMGLGSWVMDDCLFLKINVVDMYIGHVNMLLRFKGDVLVLEMANNTEFFLYEYFGTAVGEMELDD